MSEGIYKRDIINFLFIVSFPMYGLGIHIGVTMTPSAGYLVSSIAYLLILLFHGVDILYKREFIPRVSRHYWILLLYLLSFVASLFLAIRRDLPEFDVGMMIIRSVLIIAPLHAFMVVYIYNRQRDNMARLTLVGLTMLLLINVFGYYVLGMGNELHSIEGRLNFPFVDGLYSGACVIAIINLMLLYDLRRMWARPITASFILVYFSFNLVFLFYINSRIVIAVMILVILLMMVNVTRTFKGVFLASFFTIPILLSSGFLIYQILSLPVFKAIMQRVDLFDVITFNGRLLLWQSGIDWMLEDQRGLIFGNGYKGHYFLGLFEDIRKLFDLKGVHHMHMHSTTLEIVVSQGLFGLTLFLLAAYKGFQYFKIRYRNGEKQGALLPVVIFLLFISHVDGFSYMDNLGGMLFALLFARTALSLEAIKKKSVAAISENGQYGVNPSLS